MSQNWLKRILIFLLFGFLGLGAISAGYAYTDKTQGYKIDIPEGWEEVKVPVHPTLKYVKAWTAPDKLGSISLGILDMSAGPIPPKKALLGDETASQTLNPKEYKCFSQGDLMVNGLSGYGSLSQFALGVTVVKRRRAYFASGDKLYVLTCDAQPQDYERYEKTFEAAVQSFALTSGPKPNSFKVVTGEVYENKEWRFSIKSPGKDWLMYTTKPPNPQGKLFLVACAPDGVNYSSVIVFQLPAALSAQQVAEGDLQGIKAQDPRLRQLDARAVSVGGLPGYSILFQFRLAGQERMRWYVCAVKGKTAYIIVSEAIPAANYQKYKDAFGKFVASFKVK